MARLRRRGAGGRDPQGDLLASADVVAFDGELAGMRSAQWISQHVDRGRVVLRCNSILAACAALTAGVGIGALPGFIGDVAPGLRRLMDRPICTNEVWLVVHPQLQGQARVRARIDFLIPLLAAHAARFSGPPLR